MSRRRVIGILGGSFNPVHTGHLMVASYVRQMASLDEVWLSLSPSNPLKSALSLASDADRLAMLRLAVPPALGLEAVGLELSLPRPSYTAEYLDFLSSRFPCVDFRLIIGSDNWLLFDKWKNGDHILSRYGVLVYPRPGYPMPPLADSRVRFIDAPAIGISSTFIRDSVARGLDMNFFLPPGVYNYIKEHNLYQ